MHPPHTFIRFLALACLYSTVCNGPLFATQRARAVRLLLEDTASAALPYGTIGIELQADVEWPDEPVSELPSVLSGSNDLTALRIVPPSGEAHSTHDVQNSMLGTGHDYVTPLWSTVARKGDTLSWYLRIGYDWGRERPIFLEPGNYALSVEMNGVRSNTVTVTCRERSVGETATEGEFRQLQREGTLGVVYDGRVLHMGMYAEVQSRIETMARGTDSPDLSALCRFALAEHFIHKSGQLSQVGKQVESAFALGMASAHLGAAAPGGSPLCLAWGRRMAAAPSTHSTACGTRSSPRGPR